MNIHDLFAKARQAQVTVVDVPNFGAIRVKQLNAAETIEQQQYFLKLKNENEQVLPLHIAAFAVRMQVVDETDKPFLTDDDVLQMPHDLIFEIYSCISKANQSFTTENVDDLAKKSIANQS